MNEAREEWENERPDQPSVEYFVLDKMSSFDEQRIIPTLRDGVCVYTQFGNKT